MGAHHFNVRQEDLLKDCELHGANAAIEKPFDIKDLLIKIDRLI
jgi:hypothetical protein